MLCEECNMRPAEVTVTTVIGEEKTVRHLCRECMKKYQNGDMTALMAAILSSMTKKSADPDIACESCGTTLSQFRKSGVLGCAECYQAFKEELRPLFARIQGRAQHAGRRPPSSPEEMERIRKMEEVRKKMEDAVAAEEFEMAARYRDELKALQNTKQQEEKEQEAGEKHAE